MYVHTGRQVNEYSQNKAVILQTAVTLFVAVLAKNGFTRNGAISSGIRDYCFQILMFFLKYILKSLYLSSVSVYSTKANEGTQLNVRNK